MKFESVTEDLAEVPVLDPVELPQNNTRKHERDWDDQSDKFRGPHSENEP